LLVFPEIDWICAPDQTGALPVPETPGTRDILFSGQVFTPWNGEGAFWSVVQDLFK
jgi:hypothetical protein